MNDPAVYRRANTCQRYEADKFVKEFVNVLQLRSDGKDSLMDVGCGSGDVLVDFIVPILPKTFSKVIGTDISPRMIEYSKKTYGDHDRVSFEILDIATDKMPLGYHEKFDHVTSFYCLHWVQNQRQALKNIYEMLLNNGDCFLVFITSTPVFAAFRAMAAIPKWSEYMKDVESFIPTFQDSPDPWLEYTKLFKEAGFVDYSVEIRQMTYDYVGYESFRNHVTSVTPFVERLPLHEREVYLDEMCDYWKIDCLCEKMLDKDDHIYILPYKAVVAYARK